MFQTQKKLLLVVLVAPRSILTDRGGDKPKVKVEYEKSKGDKDQNPGLGRMVL